MRDDAPTLDAAMRLLPLEEPAARAALAGCFDAALAHGDAAGQHLAAAGVLLAMAAEFADFRRLPLWLARFGDGPQGPPPRPQDQARIDAARLATCMLDGAVASDHPAIVDAADRLGTALADEALSVSGDERLLLWKCLFDYRMQRLDTIALRRIATQAQDFLARADVSPIWRARWWLLTARSHEFFGEAAAAADALDRAGELAATHRLVPVRYELLCVEMTAALKLEAWPRAEAIAREIERLLPDVRAGRVPSGLRALAWRLLCIGEAQAALQRLDSLLAVCEDVQVPQRDRGAYHVLRAYALMALERYDDAARTLRDQLPHQRGDQLALLETLVDLSIGLGHQGAGHAEGVARVCAAIRRCAALQFDRFLLPLPRLAAAAVETAWQAGVEPEFVTRVVRQRRLVPADDTREDWPWRLHLRVFGGVEVVRDGQPLQYAGKRPRKPLELLALLVAQGRRALPVDAAIEALWPSPDAEAPKASLEVALARLRKLLDVPGAVLVADGELRLDLRVAWTDAAAFETSEQRWLAQSAPGLQQASIDAALASARRAIGLYRGALRAGETLAGPWQLLRERYARRHMRLVVDAGAALETRGDWRIAAEIYERGVACDVLAEPIYRALMRCQIQLGERAEALRTYARCRELLQSSLGVAPAADTQALRAQALGTS